MTMQLPLSVTRFVSISVLMLALTACSTNLQRGWNAYQRGDYKNALKWYQYEADQGDANAQNNMGFMYEKGHGVPQNHTIAVEWYRKAAIQGFTRSQTALGLMYFHGHGAEQDEAEAIRLWRKAAKRGFASAEHNLGYAYVHGRGVKHDHSEGAKWYRRAASRGHTGSQHNLGYLYVEGQGVPRNLVAAWKWMRLSEMGIAKTGKPDKVPPSVIGQRMKLEAALTPQQKAAAERLVRKWKPWKKR
jgi:TPR repeat protein